MDEASLAQFRAATAPSRRVAHLRHVRDCVIKRDADPRNRPAVATLVWLLLRQDRGDDAADVLARCPAEQF